MAWAEAALEEMGLAQIWVRRGQRAESAEEDAAPAAASGAADDVSAVAAATVAAAPRPVVEQPRDAQPSATRALARDDTPPVGGTRDAARAGEAGGAPRAAIDDDRASVKPAPAAADDMPPVAEDDFAWFDAAPPGDPLPPAESRPAATPVAMLDWDTLAARVAECTSCRLCEKRTNTVFGVGDREADWMLIGEAPGENEDKQGEPFVGQAGKLLDNMLQSLALKRGDNVYIANVIKCRPPGNRNPEPDEVARCEPYLQRQVALVKPKLIVALGRFAAQTLLKTDASIASLRGRVHTYESVPVIVTYHPAYLLRSLQDKSKAWADLCLARDTFQRAGDADANGPAGQ
ncbi:MULTISPECIES: uracil-DNA glycosylase [unclassified Burkholderia]|uniref:uracil-DNA glycosylase n=1 Tax=unclassified Burkholderia TaxID=2613784 RepID=UPI000F5632CE|nr:MULTISPECIES: uracil-DNA glycosylase [unclassified Burkholderia]RQR25657.1 uracil-DNA glycosylase [Burkholderia sp. Bp9142]RQR44471.1 uracil-DNA glycosylase [Burkholderia sp. Bp9140]